ncbi:MAG: hemolysin family protein [Pseudomonadota bacterium]
MDLVLWLELITFAVLMLLSGFFSSSETAFFSLSTLQLEQMRRDENPRLDLIKRMLSEPRRLIVTILIGNEFVNVAASVISAAIVIDLLGAENKYINLFIMIPILLLVGEITPKTLALRHSVSFSSFQSRWITLFAKLIYPLRWAVRLIADWITTILIGKQRTRGNIVTQDMMRTLAHEAKEEGVLDRNEAHFIDQIFDFGHKTVADIMTPRSAILYLAADLPLSDIISELTRIRHTRVPVYQDNRDNVIGILYARDLLRLDLKSVSTKDLTVHEFLRNSFFVPEVKPAVELFETFRERNLSFALTIDEFGGVTGLVTVEDILEHIFGDIRTLSGAAKMQGIEKMDNGRFAIDGEMSIAVFNQELGTSITDTHAQTIAGLVLNTYGELPPKDALVEVDGLRFIVANVDQNRITELLFEHRTDSKQIQATDQAEPDPQQNRDPDETQQTEAVPAEDLATDGQEK